MSDPLGGRPLEDLTARARIRDAAIRLFAEQGIEATSIRAIAAAAGVSGGLVRHHFGAKEDLRAACDAYVLDRFMRLKEQAVLDGGLASASFLSAAQPVVLLLLRYFARSMLDGSPAADEMFAEVVTLAERWIDEHHRGRFADPKAYAALLVAVELGSLVLREQLGRELGADIFQPEGHLRFARAKLDLYSKPLLDPDLARRAQAALEQIEKDRQAAPRRGGGPR